jgi:predicted MPP superfamily phosphohydrolase
VYIPDLYPAHIGVRIAHLTDIHVGLLTPFSRIHRAVALAREAAPDLTVVTGDFLCYSPKFVEPMGELLADLPGEVTCVLGNHDYWTDAEGARRVLSRRGYAVLRNQHRVVRVGGAPLQIVGVDDAVTGHADVHRAFAHAHEKHTTIALTHVPNLADGAIAHGGQLVFAGHTHGGHVNIPRVTARIAERFGNRYLAGFYAIDRASARRHGRRSGLLYVSCGIGSSSIPIRAGAPAEVAILTLRRAPDVWKGADGCRVITR